MDITWSGGTSYTPIHWGCSLHGARLQAFGVANPSGRYLGQHLHRAHLYSAGIADTYITLLRFQHSSIVADLSDASDI